MYCSCGGGSDRAKSATASIASLHVACDIGGFYLALVNIAVSYHKVGFLKKFSWILLQFPLSSKLVSQTQPSSAKEGKGLVNCVYKPCPAALYSAVQLHCSVLSHDALRHCLSSNSSLENGERELGHLFRYCRSCKIFFSGSALTLQQVIQVKSGYAIQLIAFRWDTACIHRPPDPSLLLRKWVGLARLHQNINGLYFHPWRRLCPGKFAPADHLV